MKEAYKTDLIHERHRHRFEFNNDYREAFEARDENCGHLPRRHALRSGGIPANDFFVGVQFHPEFKSRPNNAHPLFREFIRYACRMRRRKATDIRRLT